MKPTTTIITLFERIVEMEGGVEGFDRQFPAFEHDSHGVEVENGKYYVTVLKK